VTRTVLLATRSAGKLRELRPLFAAAGIRAIDLADAGVPEDPAEEALEAFATFAENARVKAEHFQRVTGLPTVADDSGLEVAALGGEPGVRSKRWSDRADLHGQARDDANNALLLHRLRHDRDRSARYVCAAAFADGRVTHVESGATTGAITLVPRGTHGFGYDPYFLSDDLGVTFAEATTEAKERVSHRGRAFRALLAWLAEHEPTSGDPGVVVDRSAGGE
jgi:XTP/dITP diphosphohydrolase